MPPRKTQYELDANLAAARASGDDAQIKTAIADYEANNLKPTGEGNKFIEDYLKKGEGDAGGELGLAGKVGIGLKAGSLVGEIGSLVTAGKRQEETVQAYQDLANVVGEPTEVDKSAKNLAELRARDSSEGSASTLASLLDSGVDPGAAAAIVAKEKSGQTSELLSQLSTYGQQKQTADEQAKQRRTKFDAIATQAGLPIDYWKGGADIASKAGDIGLGMEAIMNPTPTARSGRTLKYEDGGDLQMTQGASDHSENPMLITNPDGSPAVDEDGNQIEVTGKETIVPDWLFDQLIEAYNKGPKELKKVFKDEIIDEKRFNQA